MSVQERVKRNLKLLDFSDEQASDFLELSDGPSGQYPLPVHLGRLPCANHDGSPIGGCVKDGQLRACSKCNLVQYCSIDCQRVHWSVHKKDCKHPLLRNDWSPTWVKQGRMPSFVGDDDTPSTFGGDQYFWGNLPAIDCLQLERNEGMASSVTRDFNLCFSASGDIRNFVQTINGLPENYSGTLSVLFNDKSPLVTNRNLIILAALVSPATTLDQAAELAMHLMYSAALTKPMAVQLNRLVHAVYGQTHISPDVADLTQGSIRTRGRSSLTFLQSTTSMNTALDDFLSTKYLLSDAVNSMHGIMMHPDRTDQRDHHIALLKPPHRLAFMSQRQHGILLPFASGTADFTEPNRLMYSSMGHWYLMDSSLISDGWDINSVLATGKACGVSPMDLYGCLFFYIKSRLREFTLRVQKFRLRIFMTQLPASTLSDYLSNNRLPSFWKAPVRFDRIETSNVADYIGVQRVIMDWADLLNRHNPHACLMICSMNWAAELEARERQGQSVGLPQPSKPDIAAMERALGFKFHPITDGLNSPRGIQVCTSQSVFSETSARFDAFLEYPHKTTETAKRWKLRRRVKNRICSKRHGVSINANDRGVPYPSYEEFYNQFLLGGAEGSVRYVEFEPIR